MAPSNRSSIRSVTRLSEEVGQHPKESAGVQADIVQDAAQQISGAFDRPGNNDDKRKWARFFDNEIAHLPLLLENEDKLAARQILLRESSNSKM